MFVKFNVGDKVQAINDAPYVITSDGWVGYVTHIYNYTSIEVSPNRHPNSCNTVYTVNPAYFKLVAPATEKKEENKMNVNEIITEEERETLLNNMKGLLDEYDYRYTDEALNKIINTWAEDKADLIAAFKKHPNYLEGKFMIVFSHNFERNVDMRAIHEFVNWIKAGGTLSRVREFMPKDIKDIVDNDHVLLPWEYFDFLYNLSEITSQYINNDIANKINKICPAVHAHNGQKTSRVINKMLTYIGYNKVEDYNREFAKYADALNPLQITRHTILSINPLDYLTMSFGNSWASCHTIDKGNRRNMPNSYSGQYSSGTISYMLDGTSMVFYTVDASYNGNDFWNEPKINRQMFHWGEDKLIQGRLYPQDNDGNGEAYTPYREIVQKIMSELFDFPNYWTISKGIENASKYVESEGTHYRDYEYYNNVTLSRPKGSENDEYITVGHTPICIYCGDEHGKEDNISCCATATCTECGCYIDDDEDEIIWIDGDPYCRDCVTYCECCDEWFVGEGTYIEEEERYVCDSCLSEYYRYCDECGEYHYYENGTYVESENEWVCDSCLEDYYSVCEECGEYFRNDLIREHNGRYLCAECLNEIEDEEEEFDEAI